MIWTISYGPYRVQRDLYLGIIIQIQKSNTINHQVLLFGTPCFLLIRNVQNFSFLTIRVSAPITHLYFAETGEKTRKIQKIKIISLR